MASSEKAPQKRGLGRKAGSPSVNTTQEQRIRDDQHTEDDLPLLANDADMTSPPRSPSSVIRFNQPTTRRSGTRDVSTNVQPPVPYEPPKRAQRPDLGPLTSSTATRSPRSTSAIYGEAPRKRKRRIHWLFYVGLCLLGMLALWTLGAAALNWGLNVQNNFLYGYPRTSQTDAVVGHKDSARNPSHFIALNLHGQVLIIELPGGDPSQQFDYIGPDLAGPQDDLLPVTLTFSDFYHIGKINMIVHIADKIIVYCNNGTKFTTCDGTTSPTPTPTGTATP